MYLKKIWNFLNKDPVTGKSGSFKMEPSFPNAEIQDEVQNYKKRGFKNSARGVASGLTIFHVFIGVINYLQNRYNAADLIFDVVVYIPLAFLIYKGKRWAIMTIMIIWTVDRLYTLSVSGNVLHVIVWLLYMAAFYKAYKVEKERVQTAETQASI